MTYQSINPASGELIASFREMSDNELERAIADADRAYRSDWRRRPVGERAGIVARRPRCCEHVNPNTPRF